MRDHQKFHGNVYYEKNYMWLFFFLAEAEKGGSLVKYSGDDHLSHLSTKVVILCQVTLTATEA